MIHGSLLFAQIPSIGRVALTIWACSPQEASPPRFLISTKRIDILQVLFLTYAKGKGFKIKVILFAYNWLIFQSGGINP